MPFSFLPHFFFVSLLSLTICITTSTLASTQCLDDQKKLLLELKNEFISNTADYSMAFWNQTSDCCGWEGVECDAPGHVIGLRLWNYSSNEPQIPREIGNLRYLTHLDDLVFDGFCGQVPIELSLLTRLVSLRIYGHSRCSQPLKIENPKLGMLLRNLTRLEGLYLEGVDLSAQRSDWYEVISSYLPNLKELTLINGRLSSPSDPYLSRFQSLTSLALDGNNLSTVVPAFFADFSNLKFLWLKNCSLKGSLHTPNKSFNGQHKELHILNSSNILLLDLSYNQLEGSIPDFLFKLETLQLLDLGNNFFNGTLQMKKFQRIHNLQVLDLSFNQLSVDACSINSSSFTFPHLWLLVLASCNLDCFPDFLKQSKDMMDLDLHDNRISGEIPSWIWQISGGNLNTLDLSSNLLVDLQKPYEIPTSLRYLDLSSNQLRGNLLLPPQQVTYVDYSNNSMSGSIPHSLCNYVYLQFLDLSDNKLSGNIPPCLFENIENLKVFSLRGNNISGGIPDKFSVNCSLAILDLSYNNLAGNIPLSIENCKSLVVMDVGNNKIDDSFPCMLSSSLRVLVLHSNKFHGDLRCAKSWMLNLSIIDIGFNNFSGNLYPELFTSWKGMMLDGDAQLKDATLNIFTAYSFEVTLTFKGLERKFVKIWKSFGSIDFSCNNFLGDIPESIGDFTSLHHLNLSHNNLTSTIPNSFGNLKRLESLDLSVNQLTGMIPVELAGLTFLGFLNLSTNNLVGKIPSGTQLQTFSPASYQGNIGLCGSPLDVSCDNMDEKVEHGQPHAKMEIEWDYIFPAFGYVVGLGIIVWILVFCRGLRRRYFEKVDEVFEKIFNSHERKRRHGRRASQRNQVRRHQC